MNFKIISVGWECGPAMFDTLRSIEEQKCHNWQVNIVDDGSGPQQQKDIQEWCYERDGSWTYTLHHDNRGAVRNQYEGIRAMNPKDEDIIVFLDLDGDQLAHDQVLNRLKEYYSDGTLVTYGSYRPVPDPGPDWKAPVHPFPPSVVDENSYRQYTLTHGTRYNHLRTVKWKVLKEIPQSYFMFSPDEWIFSPADLIVMMGALELAGGRYKCIEETLLLYNDLQPYPDHTRNPDRNVRGSDYTFGLPPLEKLTNV